MTISRQSRAERKARLALTTQFSFGQKVDRIDWEYDVLYPTLDAIKSGRAHLELSEGKVIAIDEEQDDPGNDPKDG